METKKDNIKEIAWVVEKDGSVWTDNLKDEETAQEHIILCVEFGQGSEDQFTCREMTQAEINDFKEKTKVRKLS